MAFSCQLWAVTASLTPPQEACKNWCPRRWGKHTLRRSPICRQKRKKKGPNLGTARVPVVNDKPGDLFRSAGGAGGCQAMARGKSTYNHPFLHLHDLQQKTPVQYINSRLHLLYSYICSLCRTNPLWFEKRIQNSHVLCLHSRISSEKHDLAYKDSNQLVLAASELGWKLRMGLLPPGLRAAPSGRQCSAAQISQKCTDTGIVHA